MTSCSGKKDKFFLHPNTRFLHPSGSYGQKNKNRMTLPSGSHFKKIQPDEHVIRLSFQNKMTTGWHPHPVIILTSSVFKSLINP